MLVLRHFPAADYAATWQAMQEFTAQRTAETPDELWIVEHLPVYTLGQNGDAANILQAGKIPVVKTDRGGQVTYHGPGQLVIYVLLELQRYGLGVRKLVNILENSMIALLKDMDISAHARCDAPGVYVNGAKIASIGLRIKRGCSYHGLALNVNMDLTPFTHIHPCGYRDLTMTQLTDFAIYTTPFEIAPALIQHLQKLLLSKK